MSDILRGNWSHRDPGDAIPDGSVIRGGNFSQLLPDTAILVGKTLTIHSGNFVNVRKDPNWTIEGGNWTQVSRCYHLHPEWTLPVEQDDCPHVVSTDVIVGDPDVTIYTREDTVL